MYVTPDEVHEIVNGLPPGATIELDPIRMGFICSGADPGRVYSAAPGQDQCETAGHWVATWTNLSLRWTGTSAARGASRDSLDTSPLGCRVRSTPGHAARAVAHRVLPQTRTRVHD